VTEQLIFPEIDYDKVSTVRGMDITICTTADSDEHAHALLEAVDQQYSPHGTAISHGTQRRTAGLPRPMGDADGLHLNLPRCQAALQLVQQCRLAAAMGAPEIDQTVLLAAGGAFHLTQHTDILGQGIDRLLLRQTLLCLAIIGLAAEPVSNQLKELGKQVHPLSVMLQLILGECLCRLLLPVFAARRGDDRGKGKHAHSQTLANAKQP